MVSTNSIKNVIRKHGLMMYIIYQLFYGKDRKIAELSLHNKYVG